MSATSSEAGSVPGSAATSTASSRRSTLAVVSPTKERRNTASPITAAKTPRGSHDMRGRAYTDGGARGKMQGSGKTAAELDGARARNTAYEYLCHLEEARQWMGACLERELPPASELEAYLRNGILMAQLARFFAPDVRKGKKIYDEDEKVFGERGLVFRHTDNINHWLEGMQALDFPKIFYPEITDIYDKKNMPRTVYCLHALSRFLYSQGIGPMIQDLMGVAEFTEEELNSMESELQKAGVQMPTFSKIAGVLAKEMGTDEAAMHAAILAVNQAIDNEEPAEKVTQLMMAPHTTLTSIDAASSELYYDTLLNAKMEKVMNSPDGAPVEDEGVPDGGAEDAVDIYDTNLTRDEIQKCVNVVNVTVAAEAKEKARQRALRQLTDAVAAGDEALVMSALHDPLLALESVDDEHASLYLAELAKALAQAGEGGALSATQAQDAVDDANERASVGGVLQSLRDAVAAGNSAAVVEALGQPALALEGVDAANGALYTSALQEGLAAGAPADEAWARRGVEQGNAAAAVSSAFRGDDASATWQALRGNAAALGLPEEMAEADAQAYHDALRAAADKAGRELTAAEIRAVVEETRALMAAVRAVNEAVDEGEAERTMEALRAPALAITDLDEEGAFMYHDLLAEYKEANDGAALSRDDIQAQITEANRQAEDNALHAAALFALNDSLAREDDAATYALMRADHARLEAVQDTCRDRYGPALRAARAAHLAAAADADAAEPEWKPAQSEDGRTYYYNKTTKETRWTPPDEPGPGALTLEEAQAVVEACNADQARWEQFQAQEEMLVRVQAALRGAMQRKRFRDRMSYLAGNEDAAVKIQAHVRGMQQRRRYKERLDFLNAQEDAAVKIQAAWKGRKAREQYQNLTNVEDPPVTTVRKFLHLLDQSDVDFAEELRVQALKQQVVLAIKANHDLDHDLNEMDIKIGLLVRNRLELEDVVKQSRLLKKRQRQGGALEVHTASSGNSLKSLNKQARERLESYQHLFYLLQTNPSYLAHLVFMEKPIAEWPGVRNKKFLQGVIQTVYNYASNAREQYLLLKLLRKALATEIAEKVDSPKEFITGNPYVIKLTINQYREHTGTSYLADALAPLVTRMLEGDEADLNSNPVDVYKKWINKQEATTGAKSDLPYEVDEATALTHEEVRKTVDETTERLLALAGEFRDAITGNIDKLPYGLRYICNAVQYDLRLKFRDASTEDIIKVIGNILFYRYINSAIIAPENFNVIAIWEKSVSNMQRSNLRMVAKVLQLAAAGQTTGNERMDRFLNESWLKFQQFFVAAATVESSEQHFNIDEYSDATQISKPSITITPFDIFYTHRMLAEQLEDLVDPQAGQDDELREVLQDLGEVGEADDVLGTEGSQELAQSKMAMVLSLTNKFEVPEADDTTTRALLVRTKRLVVDAIRFQQGKSLLEILQTPATPEMEQEHKAHSEKRQAEQESRRQQQQSQEKTLGRSTSGMVGDAGAVETLEGIKAKILENAALLEKEELCTKENGYQDLLNAVAQDIRNQRIYRRQRRTELTKLTTTLEELASKEKFQREQVDSYDTYVSNCVDVMNKGLSKKKGGVLTRFKRNKVTADDQGLLVGSIKYSGYKLKEKGVIVKVETVSTSQLKLLTFVMTAMKEPGHFNVKGSVLGNSFEDELVLADLLQLQYDGIQTIKMWDLAVLNVNLLIFLINRKFYGR